MFDLPLFAATEWITQWLTPFWILGVGCLLGLLCLLAIYGLAYAISLGIPALQPTVRLMAASASEGPMYPILLLVSGLALFGILGYFIAPEPGRMLAAAPRAFATGERTTTAEIPPVELEGEVTRHGIPVEFSGSEIRVIRFQSDQDVVIFPNDKNDPDFSFQDTRFPVAANESKGWALTSKLHNPFSGRQVRELFVINNGDTDATLEVTTFTSAAFPQMGVVWITAIAVVAVFCFYFLQALIAPKVSAVSLVTAKSELNSPLFLLVATVGCVALLASIYMPYFTFGEDIKVLKENGLTWIMVSCIFLGVWAASTSIADEIDGRTALTVLSKPIGRRSFIIGKFLGIVWMIAVMFAILGVVFMLTISYKTIYDAKETSQSGFDWITCHQDAFSIVPALILAFMEVTVITAISVAISTRLPLLANFVICFTIYVLGHLSPLIVESSTERFAIVKFFSSLIATAFPVLEHFSVQAAFAGGKTVPLVYLSWSLLYCLIYGAIALLIALLFFEDRDLA